MSEPEDIPELESITEKKEVKELDLYIPMKCWFCEDVTPALPWMIIGGKKYWVGKGPEPAEKDTEPD